MSNHWLNRNKVESINTPNYHKWQFGKIQRGPRPIKCRILTANGDKKGLADISNNIIQVQATFDYIAGDRFAAILENRKIIDFTVQVVEYGLHIHILGISAREIGTINDAAAWKELSWE